MSWRGMKKALNRLPHQVMSKVGQSERTVDEEYEAAARQITEMRHSATRLNVDAQRFRDSVSDVVNSQYNFIANLCDLYRPLTANDVDMVPPEHPKHILQNGTPAQIQLLESALQQVSAVRDQVFPELDLIDRCVVNPTAEFLRLMGQIGKVMEKRERKLVDYDRTRGTLRKLREKDERGLGEEQKIHTLDNHFEVASRDYNFYNDQLKDDLPRILQLRSQLMEPCLINFYKLQLKVSQLMVFYLQNLIQSSGFDPNSPALSAYLHHAQHVKALLAGVSVAGHFHTEAQLDAPPEAKASPLNKATGLFTRKKSNGSLHSLSSAPSVTPAAPTTAAGPSSNMSTMPQSAGAYDTKMGATAFPAAYGSPVPPPPADGMVMPNPPSSAHATTAQEPPPPAYTPSDTVVPPSYVQTAGGAAPGYGLSANAKSAAMAAGTMGAAAGEAKGVAGTAAMGGGDGYHNAEAAGYDAPMLAIALYDYTAQEGDDLSFKADDKIEILGKTNSTEDWWKGKCNGQIGMFPANYVRIM
ncbi:BAR adaptor protein Hob1 [Tieghemiomyces parasiticus]|uniref:BAR adaptor protein Hob1 n=1 Tax=Tieghemiomyces parasiticus TaxID=78921 RepID=A0A9W8ABR3_9FUNG|nr:BAR adaptor protein Hob1 [Tieghemiomyces parasiticus]